MKTFLRTLVFAVSAIFILSSFSLRENPEDPPRGEKKKKLKMVKVEDGKKTVIDTVITSSDDALVWFDEQGIVSEIDSVVKEKLKKIQVIVDSENGKEKVKVFQFDFDSDFDMDFDFDIDTKVIAEGDSIRKIFIMKHGDKLHKEEIVHLKHPHHMVVKVPDIPHPPIRHKIIQKHLDNKNIIFLDDPDIISYKKKELSDGREKIEIIRKKNKDEEVEIEVEVEVEEIEE